MTEKPHGGKREGSGRKPKDPTTTINFRVPVDKVTYLKPLVSTYIKGLLNPEQKPVEKPTEKPVKKETTVKNPVEQPAKKETIWDKMDKLRTEK